MKVLNIYIYKKKGESDIYKRNIKSKKGKRRKFKRDGIVSLMAHVVGAFCRVTFSLRGFCSFFSAKFHP